MAQNYSTAMKQLTTLLVAFLFSFSSLYASDNLTEGFSEGNPEIESIHALAFGPEGILFIGDSQAAQIVAIDFSAHQKSSNEQLRIPDLEGTLSSILGSASDQFQLVDMAVNPANENIYLAVNHSSGKSFLFLVNNNTLEQIDLKTVSFSKLAVSNAVAVDAKDRRGRSLRRWAISDMHYADGKVMLSGLSNAEFASTFRAIPFPFTNSQKASSLEIYHAAHGRYETNSPIKTFTTVMVNDKPHLLASYTCTPLVVFPMDALKDGGHTKGRTVAELGNSNTPLDIIELEKEGKRYILMANSNRALMKIDMATIEDFGDSLTERVTVRSGTAGIDFINLPFVNVQQLSKLNDNQFVMVQRESNGKLALKTGSSRWL